MIETSQTSEYVRDTISNDVSKSIFIDAGAGAGKTTSIVGRVMAQILAGVSPKRIVVITFTNKATEEILARINKAIFDASIDKKRSIDEREIFKKAFRELPGMNISTIHSFCFTLLSEKSLNIKLPVGVKLIEEVELSKNQKELFSKWIKTLSRDEFFALYDNGKFQYGKIYEPFLKFCEYENSECEILEVKPEEVSETLKSLLKYKEDITELGDQMAQKLFDIGKEKEVLPAEAFFSAGAKRMIDHIDYILVNYTAEDLAKLTRGENNEVLINRLISIFKDALNNPKVSTRKKLEPEDKEFFDEESLRALVENIIPYKESFEAILFYLKEARYIKAAYKAYQFYKKNRSLLTVSNNQLLYLANEVIKDQAARLYFAKKYDVIYVDEFQDTDNLQAELVWNLTSEIDRIHKEEGREIGSLVLVGDPKQSIYRFRGAEPGVFFKIKNDFETRDSIIYSLTYNFRSNSHILDFVNDRFSNLDIQGEHEYTNMIYTDTHIVPAPEDDKCIAGVFKLAPFEGTEEDYISNLICQLIDNKYTIPRWNKDSNCYEWDLIKYSDFMVLFHQFKGCQRFLDSFKKYNIPVTVNGRVDFINEHGIKAFRRVFRGLVLPFDRLSKAGAIESLRMNGYYDSEKEEDSKAFYRNLFDYIKSETNHMSAYGKALYLINHLELILGDNDSYQSIRTKLQQMYENALSLNFVNGQSLADYFDEYCESKIGDQLVMKMDVNSVRFMNAHKSKGLEAPIVIWVDNGSVCTFKDKYYKDGNKFIYNLKADKALSIHAELEDMRELGRLEYVAATRAEQCLIITPNIVENKLFNRADYDYDFYNTSKFKTGNLPKIEKKEIKEKKPKYYKPEDSMNIENMPSLIHTSPSSYEVHSARERGNTDPNRPKGNVLGTIMHRALELLVLRRDKDDLSDVTKGDIDQIILTSLRESTNDLIEVDTTKHERFLRAVLNSAKEYYFNNKYLCNADMVEPELTYQMLDEDIESPFRIEEGNLPIYLNGTMDLFIKYKDSILIIDYKSDFAGYQNEAQFSEILKSEYENQLKVYKESAGRMFPDIKNITAKIVYFREYDYDKCSVIATEIDV